MQGRGVRDQGRGRMQIPVAAGRRRYVLRRASPAGRELRPPRPRRTSPRSGRARCRRGAGGGGTGGCPDGRIVMSGDVGIGIVGYGIMGKARVLNAVGFNYRSLPAVSLMKRMIGEGAVGKIRLLRATWLSDEFVDPTIPFDWRFDRSMGGTTIADLGSHLIDLATWMAGPIAEVSGQSETFIRQRSDKAVTVDEASAALVRFESGARGGLEMARVAVRRPCDFTIEVNGDRGTLVFEYARLNELLYGDAGDRPELYGMRRIRAEQQSHPYAADWWPIGQGVGYGSSFVNHLGDLLDRWPDGPWEPDFAQGAAVQAVCDAIERSAAESRWVDVPEIVG